MAINQNSRLGFPADRGGVWIEQPLATPTDGVFIFADNAGVKWKLSENSREPYYAKYAGCYGAGDKTAILQAVLNNSSITKVVIDNQFNINGALTIPAGKIIEFVGSGKLTGTGTISGSGFFTSELRTSCFATTLTVTGILPTTNVITPINFGAVADNVTDDGPAANKMFTYFTSLTRTYPTVVFPAGRYLVNTTINLPGNLPTGNGIQPVIILGYGAEISTTANIPVFYRYPPDQSTALSTWINSYMGIIKGFRFIGNSTIASPQILQKAIYIGAIYNWHIADIRASAFHVPVQFEFALKCTFENMNLSSFSDVGFRGTYGGWSGGTNNNSAFNANFIRSIRFFCVNGSQAGLHLRAMDQTLIQGCVVEGSAPQYNFWLEDAGSTGVNINTFDHCWSEAISVSPPTVNFRLDSRNITKLIACQRIYPDTYIDATGYETGEIVVDSLPYLGNIPTGSNSFLIKSASNSVSYKFINCGSATVITDPLNWDGDTVPGSLFVESKQVGISEYSSSGILRFIGGYNNSIVGNRRIDLQGNIIFGTDNLFMLGGRGATSTGASLIRPHTIHAGEGGVNVDPIGKFRFRDINGVSDLALSRDAAGVLEVESTAAFLFPKGTIAQRPTGVSGQMRFVTESNSWEGYNGSIWQPIGERIVKQTLTTTGSTVIAAGETLYEIHLKSNASITIDIGLTAAGTEIEDDVVLTSGATKIISFKKTADSSFTVHYTYVSGTGNIDVILVKKIY